MPISVGDAMLAAARLRPRTDAARRDVLSMLGFESARVMPATPAIGPWKPNERPAQPPPIAAPPPTAGPRLTSTLPPALEGRAVSTEPLSKITFARPAPTLPASDSFKPAAGRADSEPPPPLFAPTHVRAILGAMLATWRHGTEVDIARIVRTLSAGQRLERLPYRSEQTLRRGAQVLVDRAEAMNPFATDVELLLSDLARLFGKGHLQVLEFSHCPARGVRPFNGRRRRPWRPPARGVPTVVVSDVGLTRPADEEDFATNAEWLTFASRARTAGTPLVALVPAEPGHWPHALAHAIPFVHWSERTSVRQIVKAVRESRRLEEGRE